MLGAAGSRRTAASQKTRRADRWNQPPPSESLSRHPTVRWRCRAGVEIMGTGKASGRRTTTLSGYFEGSTCAGVEAARDKLIDRFLHKLQKNQGGDGRSSGGRRVGRSRRASLSAAKAQGRARLARRGAVASWRAQARPDQRRAGQRPHQIRVPARADARGARAAVGRAGRRLAGAGRAHAEVADAAHRAARARDRQCTRGQQQAGSDVRHCATRAWRTISEHTPAQWQGRQGGAGRRRGGTRLTSSKIKSGHLPALRDLRHEPRVLSGWIMFIKYHTISRMTNQPSCFMVHAHLAQTQA